MYYPVCGMVHIKDILLLIKKSSPCSSCSGFPLILFNDTLNTFYLSMVICQIYGKGHSGNGRGNLLLPLHG